MLKKMLGGTLVLGFAAAAVLGTDVLSYARTMCGNVREAVKSEISPELNSTASAMKSTTSCRKCGTSETFVARPVVEVRT